MPLPVLVLSPRRASHEFRKASGLETRRVPPAPDLLSEKRTVRVALGAGALGIRQAKPIFREWWSEAPVIVTGTYLFGVLCFRRPRRRGTHVGEGSGRPPRWAATPEPNLPAHSWFTRVCRGWNMSCAIGRRNRRRKWPGPRDRRHHSATCTGSATSFRHGCRHNTR